MDAFSIAFGTTAALGAGFGGVAAYKSLNGIYNRRGSKPPKRDRKDKRQSSSAAEPAAQPEAAKHKTGTVRQTNCLSLLADGVIRMRDGGYMRGYRVQPQATLFSDSADVDRLYDSLSIMLGARLPVGSGFQYRLAKHPDAGELLIEQKMDLLNSEIRHEKAFGLKLREIDYHFELARESFFHTDSRSLWIHVPVKHGNDNSRNAFTEFVKTAKNKGIKSALNSFSSDQIVKRLIEDEREALEEAERHFRAVESVSPLKLVKLSRQEVWEALYFGQNENAKTAPQAPVDPRTDLQAALCGERIRGDNSWYLLHGSTPVSIITLFVPPESNYEKPNAHAGLLRSLANNPNLSFRHTIITEYLTIDKEKTEVKYKKAVGKIEEKEDTAHVTRGMVKFDRKDKRKKQDLIAVQDEMMSVGKNPIQMRFFVVVYGESSATQTELEESVKKLEANCEAVISLLRRDLKGSDAALEEPAALRAIYEKTLIGEMPRVPIEREIEEQSDSLCIFIPAESSWNGISVRPHSFYQTTSGKLIGINLLSNNLTTSTTCVVLGETGSGKTVFVSRIITDVLAHIKNARVMACDFGESLRPLVEVMQGRHLRFVPAEVKTMNIWDYEGLERGVPPDAEQTELVVEEQLLLLQLDNTAADFRTKRSVLRKCVREVYADEVPRNRRGVRRHEPVLEHLVSKLRNRYFESADEEKNAQELATLLEDYLENPWLNSPTHETYREKSAFDVFELSSLSKFPEDIRRVLAFRVGARMINAIGETEDGEFMPTLNIFDEMHKYTDNPDYAVILRALKMGAREGRKANVLTMLITHTYHDIEELHGIVENTGTMLIGKQTDIASVKKIRKWSDAVEQSIYSINNVEGSHAQYVMIFGKGDSQQAEMVHVSLSPTALWTYTSNPSERNARTRVKKMFPHWTTEQVVDYCGGLYPHGLKMVGVEEIDPQILEAEFIYQKSLGVPDFIEDEAVIYTPQPEPDKKPPVELQEVLAEMKTEVMSWQKPATNATLSRVPIESDGEESETALPQEEEIDEMLFEFFGDDPRDRERQRLKDLGIDIPGVIIIGENKTEDVSV